MKKRCLQISPIPIKNVFLPAENEILSNKNKKYIEMAEQKVTNEPLDLEEAVSKSEAFLVKNKTVILGAIAVVIVIIAGVFAYQTYYRAPREHKAQVALFRGEQYFEEDNYEYALNGDSIGFAGLLKVADEYSGTKAANLARAYAGLSLAHLGRYDEAVKELDKFDAGDLMVAPAIKGAMGNCYAQAGQLDKAASLLMSAASQADNTSLSPIFLQQAADIFVSQQKYDQALNAYKTIKEKYFNSYQALDIDKYIEKVELMK